MQLYDFLMVLTSIIIGLGMAEIFTGVGQLLRAQKRTHVYSIHGLFVAIVFVGQLHHWWTASRVSDITTITFPGVLFFVTGPILLFLLGYLAFPSTVVEWDLESYYYTFARQLWMLVALYLVTAALFRPVVLGGQFVSWENLIRAAGVALCLLLGFTKRRLVHTIGVTSASVLLFIYVALFTFRWD